MYVLCLICFFCFSALFLVYAGCCSPVSAAFPVPSLRLVMNGSQTSVGKLSKRRPFRFSGSPLGYKRTRRQVEVFNSVKDTISFIFGFLVLAIASRGCCLPRVAKVYSFKSQWALEAWSRRVVPPWWAHLAQGPPQFLGLPCRLAGLLLY